MAYGGRAGLCTLGFCPILVLRPDSPGGMQPLSAAQVIVRRPKPFRSRSRPMLAGHRGRHWTHQDPCDPRWTPQGLGSDSRDSRSASGLHASSCSGQCVQNNLISTQQLPVSRWRVFPMPRRKSSTHAAPARSVRHENIVQLAITARSPASEAGSSLPSRNSNASSRVPAGVCVNEGTVSPLFNAISMGLA